MPMPSSRAGRRGALQQVIVAADQFHHFTGEDAGARYRQRGFAFMFEDAPR